VEVIDADPRRRQRPGHRRSERRGGVDSDDLDPAAPGRCPGREPGCDSGTVTAVNDADHLSCLEIHERRHPRLDPSPRTRSGIAEEPHRAEPVLIDPEKAHRDVIDRRQRHDRDVDRGLHRGPRDRER
jgi:hypothetical protein